MKDYKPDTNQSIIYIVRSILEKSEIYIGKTNRQFSKRKQEHLDEARKGDGTKFHNALINTGFANWEWEILEICERAKEFDIEKKYIDKFSASNINLLNTASIKKVQNSSSVLQPIVKRTPNSNTNSDLFRREAGILKPVINLVTGKKYKSLTDASETENEAKSSIRISCNTGAMLKNNSRFAWLDLDNKPILNTGHSSEKVIGLSARKVKNLITGKLFKNTYEAAKEHNVSHTAIHSNASGKSYLVKKKWVFCYLDDSRDEILNKKHSVGLDKLKDKNSIKYIVWHINDLKMENLYKFENLESLSNGLYLKGTSHVKSVCEGKRTHVEHWRVAFADNEGNPVLKKKHHQVAKRVIRQVICLDDEKIFQSLSEAGSNYQLNSGQIGKCAAGKAKSVRWNGKRLRFAYVDKKGKPLLMAIHNEILDTRGKQRLMHIHSGQIFNSLTAFCRKTGVSQKRAKKFLAGEKVDLMGHEFIVLKD